MINKIERELKERVNEFSKIFSLYDMTLISNISRILINTLRGGGSIFICGNGGSYSQSLHFAAELTNKLVSYLDVPKSCIVLGSNPSHITACANDYGYEYIFSRELEAHTFNNINNNHALIVLSTNGKSKNIINVLDYVNNKVSNITSIGLYGKKPSSSNKILCHSTYSIFINSDKTNIVQEQHLIILHILAKLICEDFLINKK